MKTVKTVLSIVVFAWGAFIGYLIAFCMGLALFWVDYALRRNLLRARSGL